MTWKDAIVYTFQRNKHFDKFKPMHYRDITDFVIGNNLVDTKGQTPANTVSNTLTTNNDIFEPLGEGEYKLTEKGEKYIINSPKQKASKEEPTKPSIKESKTPLSENDKQILIPAYGMYWMREGINWDKHPKLLGVQSTGVPPIDLSEMRGVYMLYDGREVIKTNVAGSKYTVWLHKDSKSGIPHLHAAICRVDDEGNINNDSNIHLRAQRAAEKVAQNMDGRQPEKYGKAEKIKCLIIALMY